MKKFYVVFKGRNPGVYDDWNDAKEQIEGFDGAVFKGYSNAAEATEAYRKNILIEDTKQLWNLISEKKNQQKKDTSVINYTEFPEIDIDAWAVDASCMGNPGKMEYRGVELKTGRELFRVGPFEDATNNIGEFLAIVHAMALMTKTGDYHNIYSDSISGMAWVRTRKINSKLQPTSRNGVVFDLMARGIAWLNTHTFPGKLLKWQTDRWGEIPADFGRK